MGIKLKLVIRYIIRVHSTFYVRCSMLNVHNAVVLLFVLGLFQVASAEDWIQPPLETKSGYRVPQPDFEPQLPRDHGVHPGYAIEWWYWVGHLESVDGSRSFGFQSTIFRLEGDAKMIGSEGTSSAFGTQQLYMTHLSLSDLNEGRHMHVERLFREGWQARASKETLDFQVGPIVARWNADEVLIEKELKLPEGRTLILKLRPLKPLVVFGERGISRKGEDPEAVSWYWTYPRLEIAGVLVEGDRRTKVSGIGWMDHEIASSQLSDNHAGWDWTAIQLDDGTEVKVYRLRTKDGGSDPWSPISWIDSNGRVTRAYTKNFEWVTGKIWKSDRTGNRYPTQVTVRALHPETGVEEIYKLRPLLAAQEFVGIRPDSAYWEGACAVFDGNNKRIGKAYLELVGYDSSIANHLSR